MKKLILALIIALAAGYGALSYHFILFDSSMKILKKTGPRYQDTFIDARGSKKLNLLTKPELAKAGIKDIIQQVDAEIE